MTIAAIATTTTTSSKITNTKELRKGNCWDNSTTERFFRSLKYEQLNYEKFRTQEAAKLSVLDYLASYNGKRIHSTFGYKCPLEHERFF